MLDKLKKFYLKLPKDILEAIENAEYNRPTRRQLKKYKKIETKIKYILKDEIKHQIFIEYINNQYNDINNECHNINEVIGSINKNNFVKSMIYMLKEFYNDNKFKEYVLSDNYDEYLEHFMDFNIVKKENEDNSMKDDKENINKYIVMVEYKNNYHNIYPLLSLEDGKLIEVPKDDYPDYGNINVSPSWQFSEEEYDIKSLLWICRFNQSQLRETEAKTKFKIDGDELVKNKDIYNINNEEIYEIVELLENDGVLEKQIYNDKIEIKNEPVSKKIYIKDENYIYGPFGYTQDHQGYYIDKKNSDYIVQKYSIKDNKSYLSIREIEIPYNFNKADITLVYFHNKENLISETIDMINDEELLDKLKETISAKNTNYSRKDIQEIRSSIRCIMDNSLSKGRRNRIITLMQNTETTEKFIENDLIYTIGLLLEDNKSKNIIADKILKEPENLRKLQNVEIVQFDIKNKKEELENLKQKLNAEKEELERTKLEINDINNKNINELIEQNQKDIKEMTDEKEKLKKDIEDLRTTYKLCEKVDELHKEIKRRQDKATQAEDDYNVFRRKNEGMKEKVEKIEKNIREKLENAINYCPDIAFDGMIANEMLESASKWSKKKHIEDFKNAIAYKQKMEETIGVKLFKDDNVIDYMYNKIKEKRNYSKNDIINIMICLTQGFLTVFAGEPGVGKTSICDILVKMLGLSNRDINYNRFTEVSVEKGWTSKRDLIGYYNPLTKSFDKNNKSLFRAFNILHQEYSEGINDFPYYILLDEANLSSMEHYWADFMNVCDLDKENRKINLGEDYIYDIPQTLRFLATINYDHTTETLSPRLIDRAWIILLERGNVETGKYDSCTNYDQEQQVSDGIVMFQDLKKCFSYSSYNSSDEESPNQMYEELEGIYRMFGENNISISQRIDNMIKRYLKVGCNLFEKTDSTTHEFVALDYVVAQKLLPKINGYGDEYEIFLNAIKDKFDKKNMMKCTRMIGDIIKKGNANMKYYQFFS